MNYNTRPSRYYNQLARPEFKPLQRSRESELAARIQGGDLQARNELIKSCVKFVSGVARQYTDTGVSYDDLIQAGNVGLIFAAMKFSPDRGKFISYAVWWIRREIMEEIAATSRVCRIPTNRNTDAGRLRKAASRVEQELRRPVTIDDISEIHGGGSVELANLADSGTLSLDMRDPDTGTTLIDSFCDPNAESPEYQDDVHEMLLDALDHLSDRSAMCVRMNYGITTDGVRWSLDEIARKIGTSRERARQIIEAARKRLRYSGKIRLCREMIA